MTASRTGRKRKQAGKITVEEALAALHTQATIPVWPHCAVLLNLSRGSAYEAARSGQLPVIKVGRLFKVATASLRKQLGINPERKTPEVRTNE